MIIGGIRCSTEGARTRSAFTSVLWDRGRTSASRHQLVEGGAAGARTGPAPTIQLFFVTTEGLNPKLGLVKLTERDHCIIHSCLT